MTLSLCVNGVIFVEFLDAHDATICRCYCRRVTKAMELFHYYKLYTCNNNNTDVFQPLYDNEALPFVNF